MAQKFDVALRPGGLTYTASGVAIDANGVPLENAPARPADTKEEDQPHARMAAATTVGAAGAPAAFDAEALGRGIAAGLQQAAANANAATDAARQNDELARSSSEAKPSTEKPAVGSASAEGAGGTLPDEK